MYVCTGVGETDVLQCVQVNGEMDVCMCDSMYRCGENGCMYV